MNTSKKILAPLLLTATLLANESSAKENPAAIVAGLDTEYQAAVERNDWQTMDRILHADFTLVLGDGKTYNREDLIEAAREKKFEFEKQVEIPGTQVVRLFGEDTAVVTALLWLKGKRVDDASAFEYKLWFSDTYVRTKDGWRYAFGQASLRMNGEGE
jgi:ketosteroid isomerase-like protein